jgi:hypothetical protein
MASKLVLTRAGQMQNRRQLYKIFIDGAEAGAIKNDTSEEFELTPGSHTIQCKVNWMSSNQQSFTIKEGANTYLRVSNGMKFFLPLYILLLAGLLFPLFFRIAKLPLPSSVETIRIAAIIPAVIYYLVYVTFLRKNYLHIGEDSSNPFK